MILEFTVECHLQIFHWKKSKVTADITLCSPHKKQEAVLQKKKKNPISHSQPLSWKYSQTDVDNCVPWLPCPETGVVLLVSTDKFCPLGSCTDLLFSLAISSCGTNVSLLTDKWQFYLIHGFTFKKKQGQQHKAAATLVCTAIAPTPKGTPLHRFQPWRHTSAYIPANQSVFKARISTELYCQLTCSATDILLLGSTSRPSNLALTRFHTLTA